MNSPIGCMTTTFFLGLVAIGLSIALAPPGYFETIEETLPWVLIASLPFFFTANIARYAKSGTWTDPLPTRKVNVLGMLLVGSVFWVMLTGLLLGL